MGKAHTNPSGTRISILRRLFSPFDHDHDHGGAGADVDVDVGGTGTGTGDGVGFSGLPWALAVPSASAGISSIKGLPLPTLGPG